jgi:lipopolysaccharide/colanic/teichoic acid biosynthesis glycosyltransferase
MFARHNRMVGGLYLCADLLLALGSFWLAHEIRSRLIIPRPLYPLSHYPWIVPLAVGIWIAVGLVAGIYREIREEDLRRAFADPLKVALISTTLLFALTFAFKLEIISRLLLGLYAAVDLVAMTGFRLVARHFAGPLRRSVAGLRTFLLVGGAPEAAEIAHAIEAHESHGMRLFGFVCVNPAVQPAHRRPEGLGGPGPPPFGLPAQAGPEPGGGGPTRAQLRGTYPVFDLPQLPELLRCQVIDEVIFAVSKEELEKLEDAFLRCEEEGVKTRVLLTFFPHAISKVYLERLGEKPLLTFSATPENEYLLLVKRLLDFVMALALLIILLPLFLILALLIKLTSRGPVLYRQTRCGLGGRTFTLYKFRSMHPDADLRREELEALNEMDGPVFKIRDDPRCTSVGRLMRRFSLDELPQLVNILRGHMSFVGPRPPLPEEVEKYERWQRRRLRMPPGLTCLWALEGRSRLSFRRWMELDLEYIDNWSLARDWKILLKTIPIVLLGRGAS